MANPPRHDPWAATATYRPILGKVGVIALVPDAWNSPWMPRHHVLSRLASYFRVVWLEPAPPWRECWLHRSIWRPARVKDAKGNTGLLVYTPTRWEAKFYRPAALARAAERRRLCSAAAELKKRGCRKLVIYIWRPEFASALGLLDHDASCYHLDDEYSFSRSEQPVDEREASLLRKANHVFIHSPALWLKKSPYSPGAHLIPMGADYYGFSAPRDEPADLRCIRRPRIGYVGYIKGQLDFPLLTRLAKAHPDWSFVFVGPKNANMPHYAAELEALSRLPNVHMLGGRPVGELPAYMQHMDVLTLGYRVNDYTKFISPMKLQEYLATGRPVVGTPIPYLKDFSEVIALAKTAEQWSAAIENALSPEALSPQRVEQRRRVAGQYDWGRVVFRIAWTICCSLGPDYVRRITQAYMPRAQVAGRRREMPAAAVAAQRSEA